MSAHECYKTCDSTSADSFSQQPGQTSHGRLVSDVAFLVIKQFYNHPTNTDQSEGGLDEPNIVQRDSHQVDTSCQPRQPEICLDISAPSRPHPTSAAILVALPALCIHVAAGPVETSQFFFYATISSSVVFPDI